MNQCALGCSSPSLLRRRADGIASDQKRQKKRKRMQERSSSIRMRRRRGEEGRQEFLKSRRSGEWAHRFLFNIIVLFFSEAFCLVMGLTGSYLGKLSYKKNDEKRGHCPLWANLPLNGSKGDICRLITDKSA